jgi:hypothetical protein
MNDTRKATNVTQKLIESHLVRGGMQPGEEIGLAIVQTVALALLVPSEYVLERRTARQIDSEVRQDDGQG